MRGFLAAFLLASCITTHKRIYTRHPNMTFYSLIFAIMEIICGGLWIIALDNARGMRLGNAYVALLLVLTNHMLMYVDERVGCERKRGAKRRV